MLPINLSDLDLWEGFEENHTSKDLESLKKRVHEIEPELLKDLMNEGIISVHFGATLISQIVEAVKSPVLKLEFLQQSLSTAYDWPNSHGESWHVEYLDLMWQSIKIAKNLKLSGDELGEVLDKWLADWSMLEMPVVLTAVLSLNPITQTHSETLISSFLECWDLGKNSHAKNSMPILKEDNDWNVFKGTLADLAPLVAVLTLNPATNQSNRERLMQLTLNSGYSDFSLAFWEYICAFLTTDREAGYWDQSVIWKGGFFANGLPKNAPKFDLEGSYSCLMFFWENRGLLDLENSHGEHLTAPGVVNMLAHHPLISAELKMDTLNFLEIFDWEPVNNFRTNQPW